MTLADLLRAPPDRALGRQAELARGLYCAVFVGELDRIEPLLALGADPFAIPEGSSRCALSVAACSTAWTLPPLAMFQAILAAGLPRTPEIGPTGETPLMFAARSSDQEALFRVQLLLPHSEVDAVAADGFSALMGACEAHNLEICSLLAPLSNLSLLADDGRDIFTIISRKWDMGLLTRITRPPIAKKLDGHGLIRHHPGHGEEHGGESQDKRNAGGEAQGA